MLGRHRVPPVTHVVGWSKPAVPIRRYSTSCRQGDFDHLPSLVFIDNCIEPLSVALVALARETVIA